MSAYWTVTSRKIKIQDYLGIKHNLGLQSCSGLEITETRLIIKSTYSVESILKLFRTKVLKGFLKTDSIKFLKILSMEIKTAIPVEYAEPIFLNTIILGIPFYEERPYIETIVSISTSPEIDIVVYRLKGRKTVPGNENCSETRNIPRDKTRKLLYIPFEIRYRDVQKTFSGILPKRTTYEHTVTILKEHALVNFLLDKQHQAKILFMPSPETWKNGKKIPYHQIEDLFTNQPESKKFKGERPFKWNPQDFKYDIIRITHVFNQLNSHPSFYKLKKEWFKNYRFLLTEHKKILQKQLNCLIALYSVLEEQQLSFYWNRIVFYLYMRLLNDHYKKNTGSLFSWLITTGQCNIPSKICKTIEDIPSYTNFTILEILKAERKKNLQFNIT